MTIELQHVSRSFGKQAVISDLTHTFLPGQSYAITGPNGSGKSTLLKLIAGVTLPDSGTITYNHGDTSISDTEVYNHLSIAAPYLELIEEFSLEEMIRFHFGFKKTTGGYRIDDLFEVLGYPQFRKKYLRDFSSGMKQRVRLLLALVSDVNVVLLDEPCTNLDQEGIEWYNQLSSGLIKERLFIVFSNEKQNEYPFCNIKLRLSADRLTAC